MAKSRKVESKSREKMDICSINSKRNCAKQHKSRSTKRLSLSFLLSSSTTYASCQPNLGSFRKSLSCVTINGFHKSSNSEKSFKHPLVQCSKSTDERSRPLSDFYRDQVEEVKSVHQIVIADPFCNSKKKVVTAMTSESIPKKLQIKESNNISCTPKNIVCAESACQLQLPDGALERKEDLSVRRDLLGSPIGPKHHYQANNSSSKWAFSRITKGYLPKRGKVDRERKHEICFDEGAFPLNSVTQVRRFKIMRHLGLVAPIGSPF
ncbi:hypothetical protein K2173_019426 [Erythroxylum novogranatense]|uniref:Uncharacterized protein n=1 Tax=Erythroxylum novogranatense TaxID=1862640 RepID=A0AAV8UEK1_9ROSI|nr:hypothetical protein K2173_019426 [Erythroxylum novogranatense]